MVQLSEIQAMADRIVEHFRPEKVVLFGSYARGSANEDSDVDLLVVLPFEGSPTRKAAEILVRTDPRFPIDLIARTPEQLEVRLALGDFFLREVVEQGRTLYESADE